MHLTSLGWRTTVGGVLVLVLGLLRGSSVAVAFSVAALSAVLLGFSVVLESPKVVVTRAVRPREVDRGGMASVTLSVTSSSGRRPRSMTILENVAGIVHVASVPPIATGSSYQIEYPVDTTRRGVVECGPLVVRRTDPFGLVQADVTIGDIGALMVRPRRRVLPMLPVGRQRDLEGPTKERSEGTSSFHQLREYVPGDDLRRIHWRSTARTGQLMVRQLVDTTKPELVVIVDSRSGASSPEDFEEMVDIAATVIHAAERDRYPVELLFSTPDTTNSFGAESTDHFDRLTAIKQSGRDNLFDLARAVHSRGRSLVFVGSRFSGPDLTMISRIARGFEPAFLVSVDTDRSTPVVAPPGMRSIPVRSADEFPAAWMALR